MIAEGDETRENMLQHSRVFVRYGEVLALRPGLVYSSLAWKNANIPLPLGCNLTNSKNTQMTEHSQN